MEEFSQKRAEPRPELQIVPTEQPEIGKKMPPDMIDMDIDDVLGEQEEENEKIEKKPHLDS